MKNVRFPFGYWVLLSCVLLSTSEGMSQEILRVPLDLKVGEEFGSQTPSIPIAIPTGYSTIDTSKFVVWQYYLHTFNSSQLFYERFGMERLKTAFPDTETAYIYPGVLDRNKMVSFVGQDSTGRFHAVMDNNNNRDFSEDKWYVFESRARGQLAFETDTFVFDYFDGEEIKIGKFKMGIDFTVFTEQERDFLFKGSRASQPHPHLEKDRFAGMFSFSITLLSYKEGFVNYKGSRYRVRVSGILYGVYPYPEGYYLDVSKLTDGGAENHQRYYPSSGELVSLGDDLFSIPLKVLDTLTLTFVRKSDSLDPEP